MSVDSKSLRSSLVIDAAKEKWFNNSKVLNAINIQQEIEYKTLNADHIFQFNSRKLKSNTINK